MSGEAAEELGLGLDWGWGPEVVAVLCGTELEFGPVLLDHEAFWNVLSALTTPSELRGWWLELEVEPARWEDDGGALWCG